jgi:hypothetical protein
MMVAITMVDKEAAARGAGKEMEVSLVQHALPGGATNQKIQAKKISKQRGKKAKPGNREKNKKQRPEKGKSQSPNPKL